MELIQKIKILADAAKYDASCASSGSKRKRPKGGLGHTKGMGICHSYTPDGRCVSLLKLLFTNHCIFDCQYCINRLSSDTPRARFSVKEVVDLTLDFYRRNYIEGLFLSSGVIKSPDHTMELLAQVARALREDHLFGGYIHLKAVAGASSEAVALAAPFADRMSVNIELPVDQELRRLAPGKSHHEIEASMKGLKHIQEQGKHETLLHRPKKWGKRQSSRILPAGQSTQMIVGATPDYDAQILAKASKLYQDQKLRRVYYSAYSPIPDPSAMLSCMPVPLMREHRLYQGDWLLRFYGFSVEELFSSPTQNLNLELDPKLSWALRSRAFFPVDVNTCDLEALLRVPGIGLRNAKRLLKLRRLKALRSSDLQKLRVAWKRAQYFVICADHNPSLAQLDRLDLSKRLKSPSLGTNQLSLFDDLAPSKPSTALPASVHGEI